MGNNEVVYIKITKAFKQFPKPVVCVQKSIQIAHFYSYVVYTLWKLYGNQVHFLTVSKSETPSMLICIHLVHIHVQNSFQCVH